VRLQVHSHDIDGPVQIEIYRDQRLWLVADRKPPVHDEVAIAVVACDQNLVAVD